MDSALKVLQGWDPGKVLALINRVGGPESAAAIAAGERSIAAVPAIVPIAELLNSPAAQIQRVLEVNEAIWKDRGVTEETIHAAGDPPDCPPEEEHNISCVMLVNETGDPLDTFRRNWLGCRLVLGLTRTWKWDGLLFTPQGVRQHSDAKPRPQGLRWTVAELGRTHKGKRVLDVRPILSEREQMGMGQELPAIGMLHPRLALAMMDGSRIPFVDAPDLEVAPFGKGEFHYAPYMCFDRVFGRVGLGARRVGNEHSFYGSGFLR